MCFSSVWPWQTVSGCCSWVESWLSPTVKAAGLSVPQVVGSTPSWHPYCSVCLCGTRWDWQSSATSPSSTYGRWSGLVVKLAVPWPLSGSCQQVNIQTCQSYPGYFLEPHWNSMGLPEIQGNLTGDGVMKRMNSTLLAFCGEIHCHRWFPSQN